MPKETFILGIAGVVIGISIFIKTNAILPSLVPIAIGIGLMAFYKEEDKIEKRRDLN